jgi:hypothetical protein
MQCNVCNICASFRRLELMQFEENDITCDPAEPSRKCIDWTVEMLNRCRSVNVFLANANRLYIVFHTTCKLPVLQFSAWDDNLHRIPPAQVLQSPRFWYWYCSQQHTGTTQQLGVRSPLATCETSVFEQL